MDKIGSIIYEFNSMTVLYPFFLIHENLFMQQ